MYDKSSFIHNYQKLEATKMSFDGRWVSNLRSIPAKECCSAVKRTELSSQKNTEEA